MNEFEDSRMAQDLYSPRVYSSPLLYQSNLNFSNGLGAYSDLNSGLLAIRKQNSLNSGGYYGGAVSRNEMMYNQPLPQRPSRHEVAFGHPMSHLKHSRSETKLPHEHFNRAQGVQQFSGFEPYQNNFINQRNKQNYLAHPNLQFRPNFDSHSQFENNHFGKLSTNEDLYQKHHRSNSLINTQGYTNRYYTNNQDPSSDSEIKNRHSLNPRDPVSRLTKPIYDSSEQRQASQRHRTDAINSALKKPPPMFPKDFFNPRARNKSIA